MTLTDMRALVRRDLKDEDSANYRWTDNEIDRAIGRAVSDLNHYAPREMKNTIATTDGSRAIDISSLTDRLSVDRLEFPVGEYPRIFQRFEVYQDTITLTGPYEGDGENCYIYWTTIHTLDGSTSTIPAQLEDMVALGASAYAAISQSQYQSDRANIGGEDVDRDYAFWGRDRLAQFNTQLRNIARSKKLKTGTLYSD